MAKLKKGSAAAKAFMARLRAAKGKKKTGRPAKMKVYAKPNAKGKLKVYAKKVSGFSAYKNAPVAVKRIIDRVDDGGNYLELERAKKALNQKGYDMDYDLNGMITMFKKLPKSKKVTGVKPKAKRTPVSKHKDTNSHNVNIRVMSGVKSEKESNKSLIDLNTIGSELYRLDKYIAYLKGLIKISHTSQKPEYRRNLKIVQLQHKALKTYLNTRAKFV